MSTAVITGSTRGLGFEMAKLFHREGWDLVLNGTNPERLQKAVEQLRALPGGRVEGKTGSVASGEELQALADFAAETFGSVQIWINNAGVNQPMKAIWELSEAEIDAILNIDLRGAILGSRVAARMMEKQPEGGFIYNLEGYGSNDAMMLGLNLYGTSKRAVTHFTVALARELEERGGKESIQLPEKTKKVYNILGDYPDVVAAHLVKGMLENTKNNAHIEWLTTGKAAWRFLTAGFNKRNFFD